MKSTKHAYVKMWQNHPEDEHENTTTTLYDHEDTNEPNSTPAALPYPPEHYASVNSMNESDIHTLKPKTETQPTSNPAKAKQ